MPDIFRGLEKASIIRIILFVCLIGWAMFCFLAYMKDKGIECNRHYPVPCHLQEAYRDLGYKKGDCPNAEKLADHCATLPLFPEMTDEEVQMVIDAVNAY